MAPTAVAVRLAASRVAAAAIASRLQDRTLKLRCSRYGAVSACGGTHPQTDCP